LSDTPVGGSASRMSGYTEPLAFVLPKGVENLGWPAQLATTDRIFGEAGEEDTYAVRRRSYYVVFLLKPIRQSSSGAGVYVGGSMTLWWQPAFGAALLSLNDSPEALHGLHVDGAVEGQRLQ